jgi:hypothetical protein
MRDPALERREGAMRLGMMAAAAALGLASCGAPEAPPVLIEAQQVRSLLETSNALDGRRVAIDGYIHIDDGDDGGAAMLYTLTSRPNGLGEDLVLFEAELGTGANQVDLPVLNRIALPNNGGGEILQVDLKNAHFQDAAGARHGVKDKVRITGLLASGPSHEDGRSPSGLGYQPRLEEVTLEAAP